jgi:acetyl esterase/lipase
MVVSILVMLRDRGLPLPAGAILISPWVDLTHSFPSVAQDCPFDYIPQYGFHHKPSRSWPPLNAEEHASLRVQIAKQTKLGHTKLMKPASVEVKRRSRALSQHDGHVKQEDEEALNGVDGAEKYQAPTYVAINIDGEEVQLKDQLQVLLPMNHRRRVG